MAEVDVRQTADGVLVLLHDESLDRTTNGRGAVRECNWLDIRTLDAGRWFNPSFAGQSITKLDDILTAAAGRIGLYLDVRRAEAELLLESLASHPDSANLLICADDAMSRELFDRSPGPLRLVRFFRERPETGQIPHLIDQGTRVFELPSDQVTHAFVGAVHAAGAEVEALALGASDTPDQWRHAAACHVDWLMTDRPIEAIRTLTEQPR